MSSAPSLSAAKNRQGWLSRWLSPRKTAPLALNGNLVEGASQQRPATGIPEAVAIGPFVSELVQHGRYCLVLLREAEEHIDPDKAKEAAAALMVGMGLVTGGGVMAWGDEGEPKMTEVAPFYMDRRTVTNREFARFVAAGCYDRLEIWPTEIWPSLMKFTDQSRQPGPAGWSRGSYPPDRAEHPVVGISWYEAQAYASWVGKRLPTASEWQKAAGWPDHLGGGAVSRYPWGDPFDPQRANVWASGLGRTAPVDAFPQGDTLNGIRQLAGNVWEWLADLLETIPCSAGASFRTWKPMRRILGGAFDTLLPHEVGCQFLTGQDELDRRDNLGFRCAIPLDRLRGL